MNHCSTNAGRADHRYFSSKCSRRIVFMRQFAHSDAILLAKLHHQISTFYQATKMYR